MNRAQMREILARRKNDSNHVTWSEEMKNLALLQGLYVVQTRIMQVDPLFVTDEAEEDTEPGEERYNVPEGAWTIIGVSYKDTAHPLGYRPLKKRGDETLRERGSAQTSTYPEWALDGDRIILSPRPSTAIVDAIRFHYVPTLTMAEDSDVPRIKIGLHQAIVFWADMFLSGDDKSELASTMALYQTLIDLIPTFYWKHGGTTESFIVDGLNKPEGVPLRRRMPNDFDGRR